MRNENGVPQEIGDLDQNPKLNRPHGSDIAFGYGCVTDDHMRALAAFIAQLHSRLVAVEAELKERK